MTAIINSYTKYIKYYDYNGEIRSVLYERLYKGQLNSYNDEPAVIYQDGTKVWYKNNKTHRDNDKPAIERPDGTLIWYKNGIIHRDLPNPAIINHNSILEYWTNGIKIK